MSTNSIVQIIIFFAVLLLCVKPLGAYMANVYTGKMKFLRPFERVLCALCGVKEDGEMSWKTYAVAVLLFNGIGAIAVYALMRTQAWLPMNPAAVPNVSPDLSFNTAVSFATNTNWQSYSGESTLSYFTQMLGLSVQNFLSAATGMAVLVALVRGLARKTVDTIGNFWVDMVRSTLYILLPLSIVMSVFLVSQGVVQTFSQYATATLVEPVTTDQPKLDASGAAIKDAAGNAVTEKVTVTEQTIAVGPAASQIAIKQLGTNGGGFFGVNSAHPFENPTTLSNFIEMLAILLIPAALCYTFGSMVGDTRQGWAVLAVMTIVLVPLVFACTYFEQHGTPSMASLGVDMSAGNMEGKETRFGVTNSAIWASATTGASNGSVNSMHDSYTPLGGMIPMWLIQLGEVIFGGVGSGLYGMLIFAIIGVFVAGLMVGRTPEYLGKKIEAFEMKMATVIILIPPAITKIAAAIAVVSASGVSQISNPGPHGFSQVLYWSASVGNNNGSAFGGLGTNNMLYNVVGGTVMWISRYWLIVPTLAIAGSLARKKQVPVSPGTLPTHTPLFVGLLVGVVLLVGALTFIPALALGPVVEHLLMK